MKDELKDGLFIGMSRSSIWLSLGLLLTGLLLNATFIPLNYTPLTWSESRERWKFIPWLNLGLYSRADWIAKHYEHGLAIECFRPEEIPRGFVRVLSGTSIPKASKKASAALRSECMHGQLRRCWGCD